MEQQQVESIIAMIAILDKKVSAHLWLIHSESTYNNKKLPGRWGLRLPQEPNVDACLPEPRSNKRSIRKNKDWKWIKAKKHRRIGQAF